MTKVHRRSKHAPDDGQAPLASWGRTLRYSVMVIAERMPALAAVLAWLASRR